MLPVHDLNHKRVLDLSEDARMAVIQKGNCVTILTVNKNGTIRVSHKKDKIE